MIGFLYLLVFIRVYSCCFRVLGFTWFLEWSFSYPFPQLGLSREMEDYNQMSENTTPRGNFLYASQLLAPNSSPYGRTSSGSTVSNQQTQMPLNPFHLQSNDQCFQSDTHPIVKTEASTSHAQKFHYPLLRGYQTINQQQQGSESSSEVEAIKAKIIAHPQYSNLLEAYMDCQKVGAPPE